MEKKIDYDALAEALRGIERADLPYTTEALAEQLNEQSAGEGMDAQTLRRVITAYGDQSLLEEIDEHDLVGAAAAAGVSSWLGNKGRFCTLTVECMWVCS